MKQRADSSTSLEIAITARDDTAAEILEQLIAAYEHLRDEHQYHAQDRKVLEP